MIRKLFDAATLARLPMPGLTAGVEPDEVWSPNPAEGIVYAPKRMASLADVEAAVMDALGNMGSGFHVETHSPNNHVGVDGWCVTIRNPKGYDSVYEGPTRAAALLAACEQLAKEKA